MISEHSEVDTLFFRILLFWDGLFEVNMKLRRYYHSFCQKVTEHKYGINEKDSKVFVFHQVTDERIKWLDDDCAITLKGFQDFIVTIKQLGLSFGKIDDLDKNIKNKKIYITFDDIFEDAVENAFPILLKEGIPFCVFISTGLIGKEGYITTEQLKLLANEPLCTIGFHTQSHKMMRFLTNEALSEEIKKEPLENIISSQIKYFAYPFGSFYAVSEANKKKVIDEEYELVFSTLRISLNEITREKFDSFLPRININENNYKLNLECV